MLSVCLLAAVPAFAQCPTPGSLSFATTLSGTQFGGTGSPSGSGSGFVTLNPNTNQITVTLNAQGIGGNITGAGLFNGTNGGPLTNAFVPFTDTNNTFNTNGTFTRTITVTPATMSAILANPSAYSIAINTAEFPNGAVIGTLTPITTFGGTLSGTSVVGTNGQTGAGAQNGGGAITAQIVPNTSGGGGTLYYTYTPTGAGTTFTGLTLNQGTTGANGTLFLNLSGSGALNNGSFSGSVPLTATQMQQLLANPSGFYFQANTSQFANGAVRAQFGAVQNEVWLPVVGNVTGAGGSQWATDVRIFNSSYSLPATIAVQYFPSNQSNGTATAMNAAGTTTVIIQPRGTDALNGVLRALFSVSNGLGSLRLSSDQPIVATARVYNDQRGQGHGTLGEVITGKTACDALSVGVLPGVAGASAGNFGNFSQRTNLGFMNPTGATVTVLANITDPQGNIAGGTYTLTLQPYSLQQLAMTGPAGSGAMFNVSNDIAAGAVTYQATAPIFAYASVVDNASGDTSVVFAQPDQSAPAQVATADVAGTIIAANQAEIQVSTFGQSRATSSAVMAFAQQMVTDHTNALSQAQAAFSSMGIAPVNSGPMATFIASGAQAVVNNLSATASGSAFDTAFMQAQVQMHQLLIADIDNVLIPSAQGNAQLLGVLQANRATAAAHLALAQQVLAGLQP